MEKDSRCAECQAEESMEIVEVSDSEVELQCRNCGYFFSVDTSGTDWSKIAIQILSELRETSNVFLFPTGERIEI